MIKRRPKRKPHSNVPQHNPLLPPAAYAPNGMPYCRVRLCLPHHTGRYYRHENKGQPWVTVGYTTWSIAAWNSVFGKTYGQDGRVWEFFGEPIEIWPKGKDGYSDE